MTNSTCDRCREPVTIEKDVAWSGRTWHLRCALLELQQPQPPGVLALAVPVLARALLELLDSRQERGS